MTRERRARAARVATVALAAAAALAGCSGALADRRDGLDVASLPTDVQGDYAVFAQRCSRCHSLARPLGSGITDNEFWRIYFEKMRRQPSSGITESDRQPILRFLAWYSAQQKAKEAR